MGTDVFLVLTKPAGSNSIQKSCSQASVPRAKYIFKTYLQLRAPLERWLRKS